MKHFVITIGCEYGAKGNAIGKKIAKDFVITRILFTFADKYNMNRYAVEIGL